MTIKWNVEYLEKGERKTKEGITVFDGLLELKETFPECELLSIKGELDADTRRDTMAFLNGYQTWTYSPEYGRDDRIRGLHRLPKALVKKYALDGYADYHFVDYPFRKGVTHGFSFMTLRDGEEFRFLGSLSERKAWTMFTLDRNEDKILVERDVKGKAVNGSYTLFSLLYATGSEEEVYTSYFKALGVENKAPRIAGYSSWYNHYEDISTKTIHEDLEGVGRILREGDLFQVDDGWEEEVGDWTTDKAKFPEGLGTVAEEIHAKGYKAGLWLAPFVCEENSKVFKEHQDWLLRDVKGEPFKPGCNWSGFYSLDIDNEEYRAYLKDTFKTVFEEWGFDLVKLDFLYGAAPFGKKGETRSERMFRAMDYIRELCKGKLILGCGIPVAAGFGTTDYSRVSCDVGLDWDDKPLMRIIHRERVSTKQAMETSFLRRNLKYGAYPTDPDVFFLRTENISLTEEQKLLHATLCALNQGVFLTSDNPALYEEWQIERYKELRDLFENATDIYVTYTEKELKMDESSALRTNVMKVETGRRLHYTLRGEEKTILLPF